MKNSLLFPQAYLFRKALYPTFFHSIRKLVFLMVVMCISVQSWAVVRYIKPMGTAVHDFAGTGTTPPPVLGTYPTSSVIAGQNTTVTPSVAPTGATSITASTNTNFTGLLTVNPTTGVVTVTDAKQAGTYTVTVRAFDGTGSTTATFALTVTNPACSQALFTNATDVTVGANPWSVAIGDFNGDNIQDLATANSNSTLVSIRLGNGSGGFSGSTDVTVGTGPRSVAIGDFNGDGNQDFAAANLSSNNVSIRLGNGSGGFTNAANVTVGSSPISVAIGDFNGDGKPDFAVTNFNSNNVSIRLGNGLGGFTNAADVAVGSGPWSVAIGDFNGDGNPDFAAANNGSGTGTTVSILLGDGAGGFSGSTDVTVGTGPRSVAIGDFNGDGKQDFAAANYNSNTVSIRLGNGSGGFTNATDVTVGTNPASVAIGDFNGDGKPDFATPNFNSSNVSIRLGNGSGGFTNAANVTVGSGLLSVAIGDFNGDGKQDIATINYFSNSVSIRLGDNNEINVQGNGTNIADGGNAPSTADHTDFGSINIGVGFARTFTIQNTGGLPLTISSITSSNARFVVSGAPTTVAANASATFTVTFTPNAPGTQNATITINNNDCNEAVYDFAVTGNGTCPVITINAPTVTQPTCTTPTGSIVVNATGSGTLEYSIDNGSNWQSSATFGGLAAGNYNIKVRSQATPSCETTYGSNPVVLTSPFTASTTTDTWTGCVSTNWATPSNWADGSVPTAVDDVVLPNTTNKPSIVGGTAAVAKSIEVQTGTILTISTTASLTVNGSKNVSGIGGATTAFDNLGTVENNGQLILGNTTSVGGEGIYNRGTFNNNAGGDIKIDRSTFRALLNRDATFNNSGLITIGASASVGQRGLNNFGSTAMFNNHTGGEIKIDNATNIGLYNEGGGTFTNAAKITIGATTSVGGEGIDNRGTFNNNTGGDIKIDRTGRGLLNHTATFNNAALITIGATASVGQRGLNNFGSTAMFNNNTGGEIKIDNASAIGLYNESGTFNNTAKITIGATVSAGMASNGLTNDATFNNNTGGQITIDRVTSRGIQNNNPFSNTGEIRIGATAITAQDCIRNTNSFINHPGGKIYLDRAWGNGIWTSGNSFQNSGEITVGSIANMGVAILNTGTFSNNALGSIQLDRVTRGMTNTSTFTNAGQIKMGNNVPLRSAQGLLNGNGSGMVAAVFNNLAGGLLQIDQTPANQDGILNELLTTFTNAGTVSIGTLGSIGGHGINNAGTFSNNACATLTVFDNLNNSSTFTNAGFFTVKTAQAHTNSALTNNGVIEYPQGNPIPNVTNNDVIIAPISTCGVLTPALQIGGSNSFTVGGTWYKDANMTVAAGTYSGNTFTVTDLTVGVHTLYFTVTDPANACPRTVGINVTVNPASVGGTVGAAQTICAGTSPADLTLTGNAGNVVKWQKSTDLAFTSPTDIASTSTTLTGATIGNLTTNTYFRAVVKNGVCDEANSEAVLITVNQQEINLQGGSPLTNIPDGDNIPTAAKGTDFGSFEVTSSAVKTFTVQNTGSFPLNISSIVSNNGLFTVGALSPASPIAAGGSATFTVTFSPTTTGVQNATITVKNNDCDEAVYDFAVTGNAVCPVITINAPTVMQPTCTTPMGTIVVNATGSGRLEYSIDNGSNWQSSATFGGLAAGNYNIQVRSQAFPTCTTTYASNPVVITLKTPPSVDAGSCKFVYNGYGSNCTNLTASATGAAGGFTYSWSPGNLSGATVQVCPTVTTTYTVTVTDANGCTSTDEVVVEVIDVRCGNANAVEKVLVCFEGKSLCVAPTAVPALLANGATLGACGITPCGTQSNARMGVVSDEAKRPTALMMQVYPNPTAGLVTVDLRNVSQGLARIEVVDLIGRPLVQKAEQMNEGANQLSFDLKQLPDGLYLIRCRDSQNHEAVVKVNKL